MRGGSGLEVLRGGDEEEEEEEEEEEVEADVEVEGELPDGEVLDEAGDGLLQDFLLLRLLVLILSALRLAAWFSLRRTRSNSSLYPGHSRLALAHWLHVGLVSSH